MAAKRGRSPAAKTDPATKAYREGVRAVSRHPIFQSLECRANLIRADGNLCPQDGWAVVTTNGYVHVHPRRRAEPEEWTYVHVHCLLHLGFDHFRERENPLAWNAACDVFIARFLAELKIGRPPEEYLCPLPPSGRNEERLYAEIREHGVWPSYRSDMILAPRENEDWNRSEHWQRALSEGLMAAVGSAVEVAAGVSPRLGARVSMSSRGQRARDWFISSFPLLGALAAAFTIIEDAPLCIRMGISVAAVDMESREIYLNPAAALDDEECRFVMAHELLHVGLRHDTRRQGRDPYLWNVSCDYVINGWLIEMGLGTLPQVDALCDPRLKGESAEAIYDRIVCDFRRFRKLATLRGVGLSDVIERRSPDWWCSGPGADLDDFYRGALAQGLDFHECQGRGDLPAGLVEEINALAQPPVPWDVELARWFDAHFAPPEKIRTYARASRRQSATPDIPRPRTVPAPGAEHTRTFGVVLDTSGSMDRTLLAKALGAIAGYSLAREVLAARVVFCDAVAYDEGYLAPEAIAGRVRIKGRGGTVLQPGIDLLETAPDFPKDGPILIITDGFCDHVHVLREHAFLLPQGRNLPFPPRGLVFRIK
jgi:predicted metal-dependent peptidase